MLIVLITSGNGLDKVFITGVSPVVMADISSGYNVAVNIYHRPEFNGLCGFTETETREVAKCRNCIARLLSLWGLSGSCGKKRHSCRDAINSVG